MRKTLVNLAFVVLTFCSVVIALSSVEASGVSNWYLFFSPLALSASFYGVRGALITGTATFASLALLYQNSLGFYSHLLSSAQRAVDTLQVPSLAVYARSLADDYTQALFGTAIMLAGAIGIGYLTDQRQTMARRLAHLADHDTLTDLLNRRRFVYELDQQVSRSRNQRTALLFMDLDGFKTINDTLGHMAGDLVLQGIAQVLQTTVRKNDIPARMGGDEFAVILPDTGKEQAAGAATRILEGVQTFRLASGGREYGVTASIGIAVYPDDVADVSLLLIAADSAMYKAKAMGKNTISFPSAPEGLAEPPALASESPARADSRTEHS